MSEIKPTPGPWSVFEHSWCETSISAPGTSNSICLLDINHATEESQEADEAQMAANARLIAEAGTVFHNTGLSPVQLVEMVKELQNALVEAHSVLSSVCTSVHRRVVEDGVVLYTQTDDWCKWAEGEVLDKVRAALAKCEGVKA